MRFGIASHEGVSTWLAARLADEGEEVLLYHFPPAGKPFVDADHKRSGAGIVPLARTWAQFVHWAPDCVFFDGTDWGRKGDELRARGIAVVNGCPFYDRLEKERAYAMRIAAACGMALPKFHPFGTITDALAFVAGRPRNEEWFFKSDRELGPALTAGGDRATLTARLTYIRATKGDRIRHILQEKIDGIAVSTAGYWNGRAFLRPWEGTLERKEFGNDNTGPKTGCSMNVVWFYPDETKVVRELHFDRLAEVLRREQAPPGIIDVNAVLSHADGRAYFLEFTPRPGFDAEPTASRLLTTGYGDFLARLSEGTLAMAPFSLEQAALAIRLSVPPYPDETGRAALGLPLLGLDGLWAERPQDRFMAYGVERAGQGSVLSDPSGLVGLSSAVGTDLEAMNRACVGYANALGIADLGYRTDAAAALSADLAAVRKAGYPAPRLDARREGSPAAR